MTRTRGEEKIISSPFSFMRKNQHSLRISALRERMAQRGWRAFLVAHSANVRYLCGFTGSNGVLLVEPSSVTLFTDGRYVLQAKQETAEVRSQVVIPKTPLLAAAGARLRACGPHRAAIEADVLTLAQAAVLRKAAGSKVRLTPTSGEVLNLRAVKQESEVTAIRAAAKLICEVFEAILPKIRPGIRENQLAAEIEYEMRRRGASGPSFETIVASGPRAALPHARPTSRALRRGELVILDMGAILGSYCSDLTRTVYLGKAPGKVRGWYAAVWEAHRAARAAIMPGVECGLIDRAARESLRRARLERYFTHSTGHGIGLEIHENPRLAKGQTTKLAAGNVVTIEPGIYIEGVGGIRIEDDVLVTPQGPEVLTKMCEELLQL